MSLKSYPSEDIDITLEIHPANIRNHEFVSHWLEETWQSCWTPTQPLDASTPKPWCFPPAASFGLPPAPWGLAPAPPFNFVPHVPDLSPPASWDWEPSTPFGWAPYVPVDISPVPWNWTPSASSIAPSTPAMAPSLPSTPPARQYSRIVTTPGPKFTERVDQYRDNIGSKVVEYEYVPSLQIYRVKNPTENQKPATKDTPQKSIVDSLWRYPVPSTVKIPPPTASSSNYSFFSTP